MHLAERRAIGCDGGHLIPIALRVAWPVMVCSFPRVGRDNAFLRSPSKVPTGTSLGGGNTSQATLEHGRRPPCSLHLMVLATQTKSSDVGRSHKYGRCCGQASTPTARGHLPPVVMTPPLHNGRKSSSLRCQHRLSTWLVMCHFSPLSDGPSGWLGAPVGETVVPIGLRVGAGVGGRTTKGINNCGALQRVGAVVGGVVGAGVGALVGMRVHWSQPVITWPSKVFS